VGVHAWQADPAWRFIQVMQRLGLAWDVIDIARATKRPTGDW
jgi:fatty-acid desaturase